MKRATISLISLLFMGLLAACQTVEGAGQDIESAGEAISGASKDVRN